MLPGELSLPEAIFAPDGEAVNRLFSYLCQDADRCLAKQMAEVLKNLQVHWFDSSRQSFSCPQCGGYDLIRKGWRTRVLMSSRGRLSLRVLQARCKVCGRTFRPLNRWLGLSSSRRFLEEFVAKAVKMGVQFSFARSADALRELTGGRISAEGLRRKIGEKAAEITLPNPKPGQTLMVDATKVKAGRKQRGEPVYLAVTAERGPKIAGRPSCQKRLVHLHVGPSQRAKERLRKLSVARLIHDGGEDLSDCAVNVQRCRWHLTHQLKHYLWQDKVPFEFRGLFQQTMREILADTKTGPKRFASWANNLKGCGLTTTSGHLKGAAAEAFTFLKDPGFDYIDTSPLEREMRELNRRADIGARWSTKGLENVLKVLFHQRLNLTPKGHT